MHLSSSMRKYDFLPGGALAVPQSDRILPIINNYIAASKSEDCRST